MKSKSYTRRGPGRHPARCKPGRTPRRRLAPMHGPGSLMERDATVAYLLRLPAAELRGRLLQWHCRTARELAQFVSIS
jgi:hypothetical protein